MTNAQPGWYPDPAGDTTRLRFFDGVQWTDQYTTNPQQPAGAYTAQTTTTTTYVTPAVVQPAATVTDMSETDRTLRLLAFIFNLVFTVCYGFAIIPLAWMIPMTVHSWGIYKGTKKNTIAFGVCDLVFVNIISGILLLCSKKDA